MRVGSLSRWTVVLIRRKDRDSRDVRSRRKDPVSTQEKLTICKSSREASGKTKPAGALIMDFHLPEM